VRFTTGHYRRCPINLLAFSSPVYRQAKPVRLPFRYLQGYGTALSPSECNGFIIHGFRWLKRDYTLFRIFLSGCPDCDFRGKEEPQREQGTNEKMRGPNVWIRHTRDVGDFLLDHLDRKKVINILICEKRCIGATIKMGHACW